MKKFLAIALLSLGALTGYSQSVNFGNVDLAYDANANLIDSSKLVRDVSANPLTGTNWKAVLYAGTLANSLTQVSTPFNFRAGTTTRPGTWSGGDVTLTGYSQGQSIFLSVKVYDGTLFSTFESAVAGNGIVGSSSAFAYSIPTAGAPPSSFTMSNFSGFQLAAVPEPTTIALGVMGGMALLARRRRNAA